MIPPEHLQGLAESLRCDCDAAAAVIAILHQEKQVEMVVGQRRDACFSLAQIFRFAAEQAEEMRPDQSYAQPNGANLPGDVFQINATSSRWAGLLVIAKEIQPWGIEAFASVPHSIGKCTRFYMKLTWPQVRFIGRVNEKPGALAPG